MQHKVIFIMGVSGSGKTTIGKKLSARTGYLFYDADNFHTKENIAKMNSGIPLTDADRWPWLDNIHDFVTEILATSNVILVCSALKQAYRERLSKAIEENCRWVFLEGDYNTILQRMTRRTNHYMPPALLQSQFEALETPAGAIRIDIRLDPDTIVEEIISKIN